MSELLYKWLPIEINQQLIECEARCRNCGQLYEKHSAVGDNCPNSTPALWVWSTKRFEIFLNEKELAGGAI